MNEKVAKARRTCSPADRGQINGFQLNSLIGWLAAQ
jgi:hypothetical protein